MAFIMDMHADSSTLGQHKWSLTFCVLQGEMGRGMTCLTIGDDQVGAKFHAPDATFDNEGLYLLT